MEPLTSFAESFSVPDGDIIKELNDIPAGGELPKDGACRFFYEEIAEAGSTYLFTDDNNYIICFADHDEIVQSIEEENCKFFIQNDQGRTVIILINRDGQQEINTPFTFKHDKERDRRVLGMIKETASFKVCFLTIAYGNLYKEKLLNFRFSENIAAELPS